MEEDWINRVKNLIGEDFETFVPFIYVLKDSFQLLFKLIFLPAAHIDTILDVEDVWFGGLLA